MDYRNQTTDPTDIVVDLSKHMAKLTQYEDISDDLSGEAKLIDYVRAASSFL